MHLNATVWNNFTEAAKKAAQKTQEALNAAMVQSLDDVMQGGTLEFYDGLMPLDLTYFAILPLAVIPFDGAEHHEAIITRTGRASWYLLRTSTGAIVAAGSVGDLASDADFRFDGVDWFYGANIKVGKLQFQTQKRS